jgi:hypothetical protein
MKVFEDQENRLLASFPQQQTSYGIEIATSALNRIEGVPTLVIYGYVEQGQYRGKRWFEPLVERECFLDHLPADFVLLVPILDRKVALEKCDHGQVARRSSERDRCGLKNEPAKQPMRVGELMKKARFANAGLANDRHQLARPRGHGLLCTAELIQFGLAADKLG